MKLAVDLLLAGAVLAVWLAALAFLRLRAALDRLHCVTFANLVGGLFLTAAVIVQGGADSRSWKAAAVLALLLFVGAATSHAIGRAVLLRDGDAR